MYKIKFERPDVAWTDQSCMRNWALTVTVEAQDGTDADPNVFVYQASADEKCDDMFSNVASMQDMNLLLVGHPVTIKMEEGTEDNIPYYRQNTVSLDFYNVAERERVAHTILVDIASLVREYKLLTGKKEETTITL